MNEVATISKNRKIRELKNFEPIKDQLRIAFRLTGLKNLPTNQRTGNLPSEQDSLLNFIAVNYKHLATEEIGFAFNLAVTHKLDVDPKHYENFSCEYLGRILSAYQKYRQKELSKPKERVKIESKPIKKSPEEQFRYLETHIIKPYLEWLKSHEWPFTKIEENQNFDIFCKLGIKMTTKEKWEQLNKDTFKRTPISKRGLPRKTRARREAERICFREYLQECREFEVDLSQLIKSKL